MLKQTLLTFFLLSAFWGFAQKKDSLNSVSVPFAIIENAPIFPGCERLDKNLHKLCLQNQINKHVAANFNINIANTLNLKPGKKRVIVIFLIAADGHVKNVKARGPHKKLEEEGIRVISSLPKMTPGMNLKNPVGVKYTLPIALMVDKKENKESDLKN